VLLVLGLVCVALQIEHGRSNEESLPFVSLAMLGIQLVNHLSQTSIFKDFQIVRYASKPYRSEMYGTDTSRFSQDKFWSFESVSAFEYYALMAWEKHVPYQAMAMAAIFMYVWIFHRVSDRRRIMRLRVLKKRPGAKEPPSDWRVMYATVAFFSLLCLLGFLAIESDQGGDISRALTGITARGFRIYWARRAQRAAHKASEGPTLAPYSGELPFVLWRSSERSQAHWGFINKLTGLVVSFFLVPQLLGNARLGGAGTSAERVVLRRHPFLAVAAVRCQHCQALRAAADLLLLGPVFRIHLRLLRGFDAVVADWGGRVLRPAGTRCALSVLEVTHPRRLSTFQSKYCCCPTI
jgi:hypothetical protein